MAPHNPDGRSRPARRGVACYNRQLTRRVHGSRYPSSRRRFPIDVTHHRLQLLVVVGSTRRGRRGRAVADWFLEGARRLGGADWLLADLAEIPLPWFESERSPAVGQPDGHHAVQTWRRLVDSSDGFVWVTPEYNHGYPAALKNAIDHLYHEWVRKPVALVSYGGYAGGARAAEQLRLVAVELQMAPIRPSIVLPRVGLLMNPEGRLEAPELEPAIQDVADDLRWWAEALKAARRPGP
jgi:NAD(P)H-dependent FMN reductase